MNLPCDCCQPLPCSVTVDIISQSRSASAQKCGFNSFDGSNAVWKTKSLASTYYSEASGECFPGGGGTYTDVREMNATLTVSLGGDPIAGFAWTRSATGSTSWTLTLVGSCLNDSQDSFCSITDPSPSSGTSSSCPTGQAYGYQETGCGGTAFRTNLPSAQTSCSGCVASGPTTRATSSTFPGGSSSITETLSDEFTTEDLTSLLETLLTSASWVSGGDTASYTVSVDEKTAEKTELKYKKRLSAPDAAFCKVRVEWDEIFTPAGGGAPTITTRSVDWDLGATCYPGALASSTKDSAEYTVSLTTEGTVTFSPDRITCEGVPA